MSVPEPLRHHGDADLVDGRVDLAVNVRRREPPRWLLDRLAASLHDLGAYPRPAAARAAVAARHHRPVDEVLLTAGAAEAFVLLARALRPRHAVVVHPQFTEPEAALRAAGHRVDRRLLSAVDGFVLPGGAVPDDADLVVLGNPTNPTSVLHPAPALARLARPGRVLVVDEAFADTVPGEPASLAARRDLPGVVVVRSLTKTWGLAGLRVGYLLAEPALVGRLAAAQPLWAVSTPALVAAELCSSPAAVAEAERDARRLSADRRYLEDRLRQVDGVRLPAVSTSGFLLIQVADAEALRHRLRAAGFVARRCDTFPGLGPQWLRLAVRGRDVTDRIVDAMVSAMSGG